MTDEALPAPPASRWRDVPVGGAEACDTCEGWGDIRTVRNRRVKLPSGKIVTADLPDLHTCRTCCGTGRADLS